MPNSPEINKNGTMGISTETKMDIHKVAQILKSCIPAIKNWKEVGTELGVNTSSMDFIIDVHTPYNIWKEVLLNWQQTKSYEATSSKLIKALVNLEYKDAAEKIARELGIESSLQHNHTANTTTNGQNGIRERECQMSVQPKSICAANVNGYINRPDIDKLANSGLKHKTKEKVRIEHTHIVLHGNRGTGKTETAREWETYWNKKRKRLFRTKNPSVWIDASNDESLLKDVKHFLQIEHDLKPIVNIEQCFQTKISTGEWFVVFDNVQNHNALIPYLPLSKIGKSKTKVIFTSLTPWHYNDLGPICNIEFGPFTNLEILAYAENKGLCLTNDDLELIGKYSANIPYLTNIIFSGLIILQNDENFSLHQYLQKYSQNFINGKATEHQYFKYEPTTIDILKSQIQTIGQERIYGEAALSFLRILSFCKSQFFWPEFLNIINNHENFTKFLYDLGDGDINEIGKACIDIFSRFSLAYLNSEDILEIPKCFHLALRQIFSEHEVEDLEKLLDLNFVDLDLANFPFDVGFCWTVANKSGLEHIQSKMFSLLKASFHLLEELWSAEYSTIQSFLKLAKTVLTEEEYIVILIKPAHRSTNRQFVKNVLVQALFDSLPQL